MRGEQVIEGNERDRMADWIESFTARSRRAVENVRLSKMGFAFAGSFSVPVGNRKSEAFEFGVQLEQLGPNGGALDSFAESMNRLPKGGLSL